MNGWQILWGVIVGLASFGAGWVIATEKLRLEVYKVRLEVYRTLCRKAANVVLAWPLEHLEPEWRKADPDEKSVSV